LNHDAGQRNTGEICRFMARASECDKNDVQVWTLDPDARHGNREGKKGSCDQA
jgi:hypothetical protein